MKKLILVSLLTCSVGTAATKKDVSPFLGDLSKFVQSKERSTLRVDHPSTKRAIDYKKMMFDPVKILQSPNSEYGPLSEKDKAMLSDLFRAHAVGEFKQVAEIVDQPGEGVLRVRFALRGLKRGRYHFESQGSELIKPDSKLPAGTLEAEAIDSMTKERVIALVDEVGQEKMKHSEREETMLTVNQIFKNWVVLLRQTFEEEKNLSTIPRK